MAADADLEDDVDEAEAPKPRPKPPAKSSATPTATSARLAGLSDPDCDCSRTKRLVCILAGAAVTGIALAVAIFGVPVTPTGTVPVRVEGGPLPPGPGPGPQPSPFSELASQIAAEARDIRSRDRAGECTAMAAAIERYLGESGSASSLDQLFSGLRRATTPAIPAASAEAWRSFNLRVDALFAALFEAGQLRSVSDGVAALGEVAKGLRDAAGRY